MASRKLIQWLAAFLVKWVANCFCRKLFWYCGKIAIFVSVIKIKSKKWWIILFFKILLSSLWAVGWLPGWARRSPSDKRIMIIFGGGSVKKNGVYQQVKEALKGYFTVEFWGIEPNPAIETLRKAIALGKEIRWIICWQ